MFFFIIKDFLNGEVELDPANLIKDLVIYLDLSLSFNQHYFYTQNKASSLLGFINWICNNFDNPLALK